MKENSREEDIKILESIIKINNDYLEGIENQTINQKEIKAIEHILSDYKKASKENELLRKDIEGWKKYCEEIEEEQTEMSNKNCELEFEIEKLQKENEELKNKLNLKQFDINVVYNDYLEKLNEYKENSISIQKIKDKIKILEKLQNEFLNNEELRVKIIAYKELIEEREEK